METRISKRLRFVRQRPALTVVGLLGIFALLAPVLQTLRRTSPELRAVREIRVTQTTDEGAGSLREAIFAADRAGGRARIVIDAAEIILTSPLPALVNPEGTVIDAGTSRCSLDGSALNGVPVLDIAAPTSVITGLNIKGGSTGILVRSDSIRLEKVSVRKSGVAVDLAEGADGLTVQNSSFDSDRIGIRVGKSVLHVNILDSVFRGHTDAAVWGVSPSQEFDPRRGDLELRGNRFESDHRGVVWINLGGRLEHNIFDRTVSTAAYVTGSEIVFRDNHILNGKAFALDAEATKGMLVERNEINHNCGGMLIRNAQNSVVRSNRVYANGYGIVLVFGSKGNPNTLIDNLVFDQVQDGLYFVGSSPVVRGNQVRKSGRAALRILDFVFASGMPGTAEPLLEANVFEGNGFDDPLRGRYEEASTRGDEPVPASSCGGAEQTVLTASGAGRP